MTTDKLGKWTQYKALELAEKLGITRTEAIQLARTQLASQNKRATSRRQTKKKQARKSTASKSNAFGKQTKRKRKPVDSIKKRRQRRTNKTRTQTDHVDARGPKLRRRTIAYKCPICLTAVTKRVTSKLSDQENRVRLMKDHGAKVHLMPWKRFEQLLRENREKQESTWSNSGKDNTSYGSLEVINFELLPPGEWTLEKTIQQYRDNEKAIFSKWQSVIDYDRIKQIDRLNHDRQYWGTKSFLGYSVYEFTRYEKVVVDCPIVGNAVYLLYKNRWKNQIRLSKKELRDLFPGKYKKIVHKGEWLNKVREELLHSMFENV